MAVFCAASSPRWVPCARPRPSCGPSSWTSTAISSARCWSTTWRPARRASPAPASTGSACRRGSRPCASTNNGTSLHGRSSAPQEGATRRALCVHRFEELGVALGVAQLVEQEIDGVHRAHRIQDAPQDVHLLELIGRDEQLLLAGAGARDVHRREGALVGDLAV